jgi:hypothetical protein
MKTPQEIAEMAEKWISVKNEQPKENQKVLAININEDIFTVTRVKSFYYDREHFVRSITHWMPLPQKPLK